MHARSERSKGGARTTEKGHIWCQTLGWALSDTLLNAIFSQLNPPFIHGKLGLREFCPSQYHTAGK